LKDKTKGRENRGKEGKTDLDGAEMHKQILGPVGGGNEAEAFGLVEPLDGALHLVAAGLLLGLHDGGGDGEICFVDAEER